MQILPPETQIAVRRRAARPRAKPGLRARGRRRLRRRRPRPRRGARQPAARRAVAGAASRVRRALEGAAAGHAVCPMRGTRSPRSASCARRERLRAARARRQADARTRRSPAWRRCSATPPGFDAGRVRRGARGARERRAGCRGADAAAQVEARPAADLRAIDVHGGRAADLDARRRRRGRQPPRALADGAAAQRARLRRVPPRARSDSRDARAGRSASTTSARSRRLGAGAFLAVSRANDHRGAGIVRLTYRPRGTRRAAAHRPGRQGHLLRHRRHQPQGAQGHVPDARRHAGQRRGRRHAARARALERAVRDRLLARAHREPDRAARLPAAGSRARDERHHHPGGAQRCRGPHGAGRHAGAGGAREAGAAARLRHAHRRLRQRAHRTLQRRVHQPRGCSRRRCEAAGRASGERVWCFPMDEDFDAELESTVADVLQCASKRRATTSSPRAS